MFVVGWVLFAASFTATVTAAVFAITLAGIPLLVAAAGVLRGGANVERGRLRQVLGEPGRGGYRPVAGAGIMAQAAIRWQDPATWRDAAYLIGLWTPLVILDAIVFTVWLTFLAGVTLPIWYWAPRGNAGFGYTSPTTIHGRRSATSRTGRMGPVRPGCTSTPCPRPCSPPPDSCCCS